jgi:glycosyltransferase involved in cell wall biosynthesis
MENTALRILYLSYEIPLPADRGDRTYTLNILRQLRQNGHYVHLVTFVENNEKLPKNAEPGSTDGKATHSISSYASSITKVPFVAKSPYRAFFSYRPGMVANRFSHKYIRKVLSILEDEPAFDVVMVNHFKIAYVIEAIKAHIGGAATIIITHNAEAPLNKTLYRNYKSMVKKFAYYLDWLKMKRYEPLYLKQYDAITAISRTDCEYFTREYVLPNVQILTPSIDLSQYQTDFPCPATDRIVILCGSFLWEPKRLNLLYLLDCEKFRLLYENGITLRVVGNASTSFVKYVNATYPGVQMTGWVPDVKKYYKGCSIALIPEVMGGGLKLKLLEAAALKKAIIGFAKAITAPGFVAGTHYRQATSFNDLVDKTIRLMREPEEIKRLSQNAYDLLEKKYTSQNTHHMLMNVIRIAKKR